MTISLHPRSPARARRRVAFYSHDTQGLGHVRRNIGLAAALVAADPCTDVLLVTGAPEATGLPLPPNTDVLTLPTLCKDIAGSYSARTMSTPLNQLLVMRSDIIAAAVTSFDPDLFVVDKAPRGVDGELDATLVALRRHGTTAVVLGLREVLDDAETTRAEWEAGASTAAVRDLYDAVWVYGDPVVCDPVREYGLPDVVAEKLTHTGYLASGRSSGTVTRVRTAPRADPPTEPYVLCLVGGGQDGLELADAFVHAPMPAGHRGVVLTGPYMRREARQVLRRGAAASQGVVTVEEFTPDAERFIASAAAVVSMAGYNSVCELLGAGRRTLLVPRVTPRTEQLLRASRLAALRRVDVMHPDVASPRQLGTWLAEAVTTTAEPGLPLDLDGLARVPELADRLIRQARHRVEAGHVHVAV